MGPLYQMQAGISSWLVEQGALEKQEAQRYVGDLFVSVTTDAREEQKSYDYAKLVAEQTPGGLNEQNIRRLHESGLFSAVDGSLDETLEVLVRANAQLPSDRPPS